MTYDPTQPKTSFVPAEEFVVNDLETLKVLSDPLRLRIRELMSEPCTVKQVALALKIPPTKLYYHINLLEKHGIIVQVETRLVSGIVEKHYQVSAKSIRVANHLLQPANGAGGEGVQVTINGLFEDARADLLASVAEGAVNTADDAPAHHGAKAFTMRLHLEEAEAEELFRRVEDLTKEFLAKSRANQAAHAPSRLYKFFGVLFPSSRK
jgi:DNA-binding transcriptional ArsR family regulator